MTRNQRTIRFLSVLLTVCLLLSSVPAAPAAAGEAWQEQALPYAAKVHAGTVFCADPELTEETGILQQDAVILVTETRKNAAYITYTVKQNVQKAWIRGKCLILLSIATPTDLDSLIRDEDVQLETPDLLREEEEEPDQPAEDELTDEPAEENDLTVVIPTEAEEDSASVVTSAEAEEEGNELPSDQDTDSDPEDNPDPDAALIGAEDENEESEDTASSAVLQPVAEPEDPEETVIQEETPATDDIVDQITDMPVEETTISETDQDTGLSGTAVYTVNEGGGLELAEYGDTDYITDDLPEARDQGTYDTCWAFAAIGGLEAYLVKQNKTGNSIDLSEFFLLYFSAHNYPNPKAGGEGDEISYNGDKNYLMNGGFSRLAYHILASLIGTTSEEDNPYPGEDGADQQADTNAAIAAQITGAYNLDASNISLIKQQIMDHGSVKVSIYALENMGTVSKITSITNKNKEVIGKVGYNKSTCSYYGTYKSTNHDILLIGWDDDYSPDHFVSGLRPSGKGAWKARNSWGSDWGINGEFWVSYEDASLLSGQAVSFTAENDTGKMADYCYSYDKGLSSSAAVVENQAVISQSFTVEGQEVLHSVGIETTEYTDKDSGKKVFDPMTISAVVKADGKEIASSKTEDVFYSGFCLLNLKDPCVLNNAMDVEVVVTCKTKQSGGKIAVLYQKNKSTTTAGNIVMTASTASSGFTVNGTKLQDDKGACDSTIKLYTKRNNASGLVTSVSLNKTSLGLKTGESETLAATIKPSTATNKTLRWYSSDTSIAKVDENGRVVGGEKSGTAVITAVSSNGKSAACTVEVVYQNLPIKSVKIYGFDSHTKRIDHSSDAGIKLGDKLTLTAVLTPEHTTQPGIEWKSSNPSVISIEKTDGKTCTIKFNKNGSARITLQSTANQNLSDWIEFTVYLPVLVSRIDLDTSAAALWEGENKQLSATVLPDNAENKKIKWSSSDPSVAVVNEMGVVTGIKDGTAVITATSEDGNASAACVVLVSTSDMVKAFVYRMYRICLLREPDTKGFDFWVDKIRSGAQTGAQVVYNFFYSDEMVNRNLPDADYLERAYEAIMGRGSDTGGKKFWLERLQVGFSRKAILSGFISSNEFSAICSRYGIERGAFALTEPRDQNYGITAFTSRLYTKMLGRGYDTKGLNYWCRIILENPTKATLLKVALEGFIHSDEFQAKKLNDTDFLKVMYRTFLDREAESGGMKYWLGKINSGMGRDEVAAGFAASDEFGAIMAKYGFR